MKKLALILLALGIVAGFILIQAEETQNSSSTNSNPPEPVDEIESESLFIPNWTLDHTDNWQDYQTLIYFGVPLTEKGLEINNSQITNFASKSPPNAKKLLTITMLDHATNQLVLDDASIQTSATEDAISLAKSHNFDGIVIDFESKSIGFTSVTDRNTEFLVKTLSRIRESNLEAHATLYGDNYFRARAYDVEQIADVSDGIMIMAYDFHKSGGGIPGPNFPISGREKYGYDFNQMLTDFINDADPDKITVIFGMFGYDWELDEEDNAVGTGKAVTTAEFELEQFPECQSKECIQARIIDKNSGNIRIYTDESGNSHEVWVESKESVAKKIELTKQMGISKIGYWANSFF